MAADAKKVRRKKREVFVHINKRRLRHDLYGINAQLDFTDDVDGRHSIAEMNNITSMLSTFGNIDNVRALDDSELGHLVMFAHRAIRAGNAIMSDSRSSNFEKAAASRMIAAAYLALAQAEIVAKERGLDFEKMAKDAKKLAETLGRDPSPFYPPDIIPDK